MALAGVVHEDDVQSVEVIHGHAFLIQVRLERSIGGISIETKTNCSRNRSSKDSRRRKGCRDFLSTFENVVD